MRKEKAKRRYLLPDPKFQDALVTRFVNNLMLSGKKNKAYGIFYTTLDIVAEKTKEDEAGEGEASGSTSQEPDAESDIEEQNHHSNFLFLF